MAKIAMKINGINAILLSAAALAFCCAGCSELRTAKEKGSAMEPRISSVTLGVADLQRSFHFYKDGLGFPTTMTPDGGILLFATKGTALMLYPYEKLGTDTSLKVVSKENNKENFPGFTFGHCVRKKENVDAILAQAEKAGGRIVKPAQKTSWGGYSGYFADPDGYLWEALYSDQLKFNPDGSVKVGE
jgi:catechol 2,3-dioxygenase-like lactoylglutathione lyase family enzyme